AAPQLVVVRDRAVVDYGDVGERPGPERMGVGDVDPALRGHPGVADAVRTGHGRHAVGGVDGLGRADVLHDLHRLPDGEHPGAFDASLDPVGQLALGVGGHLHADAA